MLDVIPSTRALSWVLSERAADYLSAARAPNTLRAYRTAWRRFAAFCEARGLTPRPAAAADVADYVTHLAECGRRVSTINSAVSAIASAHKLSRLPDPTQDEALRVLLEGIRRKLGAAAAQKAPVTREDLRRMVAGLPDSLAGARDRALILLGWAGAFRRSELVALDVADLQFTAQGVVVTVKRSKTDQAGEGMAKHVPALHDKRLCPVAALRTWLDLAGIKSGPVFRKVDRWGTVRPRQLNDRAVATIVKRAARQAGLEPRQFAGHSLRAGFATQAASDGVPSLAIREVTGHKSDRMLARYVRSGGHLAREAVRRAFGE